MSITSIVNNNIGDSSFVNAQKPTPPTITNYSVDGIDDTALLLEGGQTVLINGTGFQRGATVTLGGVAIGVVTWINSNQLSFTSTARTAGTYTLFVINADGGTAIYLPGIIYSSNPNWVTNAGSLGSYYETKTISNTIIATDDIGSNISYSLSSGSLPDGATLYANGVISGTAPVDNGSTTYTFTIEATDGNLQSSTRSFSLTINTDVVTWVNPSNEATLVIDGLPYNTTLNATSAAGYNIGSYIANTLPSGLTLTNNIISGTPTESGIITTLLTATSANTNRSANNIITWIVTINDPYWEYVNTLLSANNNTLPFTHDASTNKFNTTVSGDLKPNNYGPYTLGYYSNYFDGTGDFLTVPSNAALNITSGSTDSFSCELWVYFTTVGANRSIVDNGGLSGTSFSNWAIYLNASSQITITWGISGSPGTSAIGTLTSSTVPVAGLWYHIALVKTNADWSLFINGTRTNTVNGFNTADKTNSTALYIGNGIIGAGFAGYISNLRIYKGATGSAPYSATSTKITVPTNPLTAITNTSLLTCQGNRLIDNSTNNFTINRNGDTTVSSFDPFAPNSSYATYGSAYFDGVGDYLTTPSNSAFNFSGNFTVEAWIYPTTLSLAKQIITTRASSSTSNTTAWALGLNNSALTWYTNAYNVSGGTVILNSWNHVAAVRSGSTLTLYLNGNSIGTATSNNNFTDQQLSIGACIDGTEPYIGYMSDVRVIKDTAVYTTNFTPPTSPLTAIANTSLLTLQTNQPMNNNVFIDNSSINNFITRNGNTTQGTFSPYGESWSNYFDGTGDFLTVTNNTALNLSSGNFTIECWFYTTASGVQQTIIQKDGISGTRQNQYAFYILNTNQIQFTVSPASGASGNQNFIYSTAINVNTWYHLAAVRNGNNITVFLNGQIVVGPTALTVTMGNNTGDLTIGVTPTSANTFYGYISNVRIVKGTAVYTNAFTPSTTPLQPIANTVLLTCQSSRIVDNSFNNFTVTRSGDVSVQKYSPYAGTTLPAPSYSNYFSSATNDYLNVGGVPIPATGPFTLEFWIFYPTAPSENKWIYNQRNSNDANRFGIVLKPTMQIAVSHAASSPTEPVVTSAMATNVWNHFALTRDASNNLRAFLNGNLEATYANFGSVAQINAVIGRIAESSLYYITGYLSNLRVVNGTALYTSSFTPSTTPLTAVSGTSLLIFNSATITDNSSNNFTITVNGAIRPTTFNPFTITYSTGQSYTRELYGGSTYFDGTGDYLTTPTTGTSPFAYNTFFGTGKTFTVEAWLYQNSFVTAASYFNIVLGDGQASGAAMYWNCGTDNSNKPEISWYDGASKSATASNALPINQWNHVAWVVNAGVIKIYVNGISQTLTGTTTLTNATGSDTILIGVDRANYYTGYISSLRVIKGQALYTSNFVPPSAPLTEVQNSILLVPGTAAAIVDASMINNFETANGASINTSVTKYGNSSMYFDGTGDWLTTRYNPSQQPGSGNLTWEMWINTTNSTQYATLYSRTPASFASGMWSLMMNHASSTAGDVALYVADYSVGTPLLLTTGANVRDGNWHHIAVVRNGSSWVLYINGTSRATGTWSGTIANYNSGPYIGADQFYTRAYTGYISDLRITNGIARYTSNFTAPLSTFIKY
jgi:hypothetical protein